MYEIRGTVKTIHPTQNFESGFSKREFVVVTDEQYPQEVKLECFKEKCSTLDYFHPGDPILARFNIRGREYNGNHYNNLVAWLVEAPTGAAGPGPTAAGARPAAAVHAGGGVDF